MMLSLYLAALDDVTKEKEFTEVYHKFEKRVFKYVRHYISDFFDAEEVAQDVWFKVSENFSKIASADEKVQAAYLFTCAKYTSINRLKKKDRSVKAEISFDDIAYNDVEYRELIPFNEDFFSKLERNEKYKKLFALILDMPTAQRDVIYMHFFCNLSIREIANVICISESSVKNKLYRGLKSIKNCFKGDISDD